MDSSSRDLRQATREKSKKDKELEKKKQRNQELKDALDAKIKELETLKKKESLANEAITCLTCQDSYDKIIHLPKVFACGHSLCSVCVRELVEMALSGFGPILPTVQIQCPECRHSMQINVPFDEAVIPINHTLFSIL